MAQFEQNQAFDKVHAAQNNDGSGKFDTTTLLNSADKVFKAIAQAAKNSVDVHDMQIFDSSKGANYKLNDAANSLAGAKQPADKSPMTPHSDASTTSKQLQSSGGDGPVKDNGVGGRSLQYDENKGKVDGDNYNAKNMTAPTETANPTPGSVTYEPHGTVFHLGELPKPLPLPNGAIIVKP